MATVKNVHQQAATIPALAQRVNTLMTIVVNAKQVVQKAHLSETTPVFAVQEHTWIKQSGNACNNDTIPGFAGDFFIAF